MHSPDPRPRSDGATTTLLERDGELRAIDGALDAARTGVGGLLLIRGAPGAGKTRLMDAACARGEASGMAVLSARGSELEQQFAWGLVRQLFAASVRRIAAGEAPELLGGAAALAAPALAVTRLAAPDDATTTATVSDAAPKAPRTTPAPAPEARFAVEHGLYWHCSDLAETTPVVLVVDDAHWADLPSLRFLVHLAHRLEGMPTALLVAARPEADGERRALLDRLAAIPLARSCQPAPLTPGGVRTLVREGLGSEPDDAFATACHRAAGGNPFLTTELVAELARAEIRPTAAAAAHVPDVRPAAVARSVAARLAALGEEPAALACAVAVLGQPAEVRQAAAVARVDAAAATLYADALADAGLLGYGRPLDFIHPLVRTAVRDGIPTGRRALLHARAFELLAAEGADVLRAATHLLHTEPDGGARTIDVLRRAARVASAGGDPATAVALQQRALREGPTGALEADLLEELGRAQLACGEAAGIATLERARPRHDDARRRAAIDLTLGIANYERGEIGAARATLTRGLKEPLDGEDELRISLQAADMTVARSLAGGPSIDAEALAPLLERRERGRTSVERLVLAQIAFHALQAGEMPHGDTVAIARRALPPRGEAQLDAYDALALPLAGMALYFSDAYAPAEEAFTAEVERARVQGARLGFATASFFRGVPRFLRGQFLAAIDDWQGALDAIEDGWAFALPSARALRALVALHRDDPVTAAAMLALPGGDGQWAEHPTFPYVVAVRGFYASLDEQPEEALALLLAAGDLLDAQGARNPAIMHWEAEAALVSLTLGDQEQARRLSRDLQRRAQRFGAARTLGIAQRTMGLTHDGPFGSEQLSRSVATLEGSGADYDLAVSLVELGAERRRQSQRTEARDLLRRALDLADRCGALRLRRRAAEELHVAGGRPRRTRTTGVEGLTSSERRVAQLAAEGATNRQIAQRLFVTLRTVETHLTHTYAKLEIASRAELAQAL